MICCFNCINVPTENALLRTFRTKNRNMQTGCLGKVLGYETHSKLTISTLKVDSQKVFLFFSNIV